MLFGALTAYVCRFGACEPPRVRGDAAEMMTWDASATMRDQVSQKQLRRPTDVRGCTGERRARCGVGLIR
jgi:hypothetical protein